MIESIIEWSIRNRFLVILAAILLGIAGVRALLTMPVDAIPDLSENQVIVFTDWMGRSPQEIEDQITYPLSVNLQGLAGVKVVRSSSEFNFSMITIIFDDSTDYYFARQRVLEKLSIASTFLPPGVTPYLGPDGTSVGQIFWYTVEGEGKNLSELRSIQDWFVRYQLNSVPGVAEVASAGGAPREYQIDLDPNKLRAFGISLGEVYSAVARSNSAVGGRVIHQANAEYLIRSIGWIESLDDIRETVVAQRGNGTPINVGMLGTVQVGPAFRRSVLEKDGNEVVGGVVLMRYGENPLEVTTRIKEKIATLQAGLPEGVRIVPFYDRTPLIHKAIETVSSTVREELIVCTVAILLVMGHLGNAFVVGVTLPMAVLFSFLLMRLFGMSSNIMSLAGISISVGILIDQAVVMGENAAHHLSRQFGRERVRGDTTEIVIRACRTVGRPIFFSVLITILSFLPVFALSGREGKMFHPLAFTKTFALVGVAVLSITLVPALIPIFLKGRIKSENENWLVRTMIEIFRPMLSWLMDRTTLVCWLFVVILGLGYVASTKLGREFMPDLNEQSLMDMPTTAPRASIAEVQRDLRVRDEIIRGFPEVWQVVGKAGRAETPTDTAPLDMIETVINLRDQELWPKRKFLHDDVFAQTRVVFDALVAKGVLGRPDPVGETDGMVADAVMKVAGEVDDTLRDLAARRLAEYRPELGRRLTGAAIDDLLGRVDPAAVARKPTAAERDAMIASLSKTYGDRLAVQVLADDVTSLIVDARKQLVELGVLRERAHLLTPAPAFHERMTEAARDLVGLKKSTLFTRITDRLEAGHTQLLKAHVSSLNWELFDRAVSVANSAAAEELMKLGRDRKLVAHDLSQEESAALQAALEKPFADRLLLWKKTKSDLVEEMSTALQMPGWGNSFTQPVANRIEMLSTGVRLPVAVKVFGSNLDEIQRISQEIAGVLRGVRGATDVFPDQIVGKGYLEIKIDRKKAARYGINVGDIQDVIEVAMGGRPLTMTVEGRERYPVRVRYARDYRDDVEALKGILVAARGGSSGGGQAAAMGGMGAAMVAGGAASQAPPVQIPLSAVADIRVVEGPSMIKSENGLLRSYIQLRVRDRDEVGFVEEAQRVVAEKVKIPAGMYTEWTGTFEHQVRANRTLRVVFPAVIAVIMLILYLTHKSWTDALLLMTSVLGALAGGAIFQWLFGFNFSVAVQVGYIACFGMAVETGVVMLVYLREAIEERGGLARIGSIPELRQAILEGAVHRLRPKLLTEGAAIISIAPMLWATGVGAEVIRPMAAPVLGGLLIADEVIDVFLPVLYFAVQKRRWAKLHGMSFWDRMASGEERHRTNSTGEVAPASEPIDRAEVTLSQ
jgi:Cu(I)/Ag(I) efflux system membrane protein CusA/SilA